MSQQRSEAMSNYFTLVTKLFHEYQWIYNFKATEILFDGVMQNIPAEFQTFFRSLHDVDNQFHDLLNLKANDVWPDHMKKFVTDCLHIKSLSEDLKLTMSGITPIISQNGSLELPNDKPVKLPKKWNLKKWYEVSYVGDFIGRVCTSVRCDIAVDIGSGLGYLSNHLASKFELPVIGIECDSSKVETARQVLSSNTSSSHPISLAPQTFVSLRITENIADELKPYTSIYSRVCLTALHACGDLTPWSLKHFVGNEACKVVAVVPCCYHKMNGSNFPMSESSKAALSQYDDLQFLKNQWLWRLASQRAGSRFLNDIQKETQNLFYRAVLERFINLENFELKKQKRKAYDSAYKSFDDYLHKTIGNLGSFSLIRNDKVAEESEMKDIDFRLTLLHKELLCWSRVITGILALQGAIQNIAEEMILLDRIRYLEESDKVEKVGLTRVIPETVSPRGMVLYGIKK